MCTGKGYGILTGYLRNHTSFMNFPAKCSWASHLSFSNLTFPICKMGVSLNFISLEVIIFLLLFTSQVQLISKSLFSLQNVSRIQPLLTTRPLLKPHSPQVVECLTVLPVAPLFPYHNSHQSSQNDHANPFRSWIIHSISHHSHSALALVVPASHTRRSLPGPPVPCTQHLFPSMQTLGKSFSGHHI